MLRVVGEHGDDASMNSPPGHRRGWSVGTWSTDVGTEDTPTKKGSGDLSRATSRRSWYSFKEKLGLGHKDKDTDKEEEGEEGGEKKKKKGEPEIAHLDPESDTTDPTPFQEKPSTLAVLVDPKSLESLEKIGGTEGLLRGLGVDPRKGLLVGGEEAQAVEGGTPSTRVQGDEEAIIQGSSQGPRDGPQWKASMEERRRVYGQNDLPERKSKSLLLLMWIAFKDKVLVSCDVSAVVGCFS